MRPMLFIAVILLFSILTTPSYGHDVDGDGMEGLAESIHALQVAAGLLPVSQSNGAALSPHVLMGQTFSSDEGTGLRGTLILNPGARTHYNYSGNMTFYLVPPGSFTMGSPIDEIGRDSDENAHDVTISKEFYIMSTEVSQQQWRSVVQSAKGLSLSGAETLNDSPSINVCDSCPVEQVSFNDIQTFIYLLNLLDDDGGGNLKTYRLPTEAEWEYASRAFSSTAFANGDIIETGNSYDPNLSVIGWYAYNSNGETNEVGIPKEAGYDASNPWGLFDMHGNVWEWVSDRYGPYLPGPLVDPLGATSGMYRVVRGGAFNSSAADCRSANRSYLEPDSSTNSLGFRLVHQIVPAISIKKTTNGVDADTPPGPFIQVGQPVNWIYEIENTGNIPLTDISVTDDQGIIVDCPTDVLSPSAIMFCTASGIAQAGQYINIGKVNGIGVRGIHVESSDPSHYFGGN